jgi:hypothetical protein
VTCLRLVVSLALNEATALYVCHTAPINTGVHSWPALVQIAAFSQADMPGTVCCCWPCVVSWCAANREKFLAAAASAPKSFSQVQVSSMWHTPRPMRHTSVTHGNYAGVFCFKGGTPCLTGLVRGLHHASSC